MAVDDAYAAATEYKTVLRKSTTADDTQLGIDLKLVSRYIEHRLGGRFFNKDASAVARVYYPRCGGRVLEVDDIASTSGLQIKVDTSILGSFTSYSAWASTDYQLMSSSAGLNAAVGPEPSPYDRIYVPNWSTKALFTPSAPVQVTAIWGWPAVPGAIKRACIELTGILRMESGRATSRVNEVGEVLEQSPEAQRIIWSLWNAYSGPVGL